MLELEHLAAGYGKSSVLRDFNLKLLPGQITAIGGVNGCGKSTLLKAACGLLPLQEGRVLLDGTDLKGLSSQQRAQRMAYLPQGRNAPELTAFRMVLHGRFAYLSFPRQYRREDLTAAKEALRWAGAEDLADCPMTALSGGQRQRVYIAMALAQDTKVILMDEPTTYLDIQARFQVMEMARRLARMGKTVVMVLHDLDLILRYADRAVLLDRGAVAAEGSPKDLAHDGSLSRIFGIEVRAVPLPEGEQYVFLPKEP